MKGRLTMTGIVLLVLVVVMAFGVVTTALAASAGASGSGGGGWGGDAPCQAEDGCGGGETDPGYAKPESPGEHNPGKK